MKPSHNILIISITRMGDLIQSIPFVLRLREKYPQARIDMLVEECFADVASLIPGVDRVIRVRLEDLLPALSTNNRNLAGGLQFYRSVVDKLINENYGEVWNLTHTRPSMYLNYLIGGENARGVTLHKTGEQRVNEPWLSYFFAANLARPWCQFNLVDIYANCLDGVDWNAGRRLRLQNLPPIPDMFENNLQKPRVALHPGASSEAKKWPLRNYLTLAAQLESEGCEIVWIGGAKDAKLFSSTGMPTSQINGIGKTSPAELASLLESCQLLISNDSGPMHISAAVGTTVIAITVGTALGSETAPYGEGHIVVEPSASCFPCSPRAACSNSRCAEEIDVDTVRELALWKISGGVPTSKPNCTCRIYQTAFDRDGLLNLKRIFASESAQRDDINDWLRGPWLELLSGVKYSPERELNIPSDLKIRCSDAAACARGIAAICEELRIAADRNQFDKVFACGEKMDASDRRLNAFFAPSKILQSLLNFFWIQKASIRSDSLSGQAAESRDIYKKFAQVLEKLYGFDCSVTQASTKFIHHNEVYHENLS